MLLSRNDKISLLSLLEVSLCWTMFDKTSTMLRLISSSGQSSKTSIDEFGEKFTGGGRFIGL